MPTKNVLRTTLLIGRCILQRT